MSAPDRPTNEDVAFETTDVDATALLKLAFALVLTTALVVLLLWRLYFVFLAQEGARQPPPPVMRADRDAMRVPLPHLQDRPAPDLAAFRAREDEVLKTYGWVDKDAGVVHIPIDQAIRILAERGLPTDDADAAGEPEAGCARSTTMRLGPATRALVLGLGAAVNAAASSPLVAPGTPSAKAPDLLREIGFDQKLGAPLPLDAAFLDDSGAAVRLGDYFGRRPVILTLVYFDCPMLCPVGLNGLASALDILPFEPGRDFELVTISFDPREGPAQAAARKKVERARYKRPGAAAGWHFLTGSKESIDRVAQAVGFRYVWDEESRQYAHPAGTVVATPDGRVSRYLFGIEYSPKDLRLALVESGAGNVGGLVDQALLYCFRYDPHTGRYSAAILNVVQLAGGATVLALVSFILVMRRREKAARA